MTAAEMRRLLELAAKAEGRNGYIHEWVGGPEFVTPGENPITWNPADNDGDSRRLQVKLAIDVKLFGSSISGWCLSTEKPWVSASIDRMGRGFNELCGDDPYAATRLAVLRAAAAIGESMP